MIDRKLLLSDLQKQVKTLEKDLREQAESVEEVRLKLRGEYDRAFKVGRTASTWVVWRDERVTQAAVAWALGTVFVRFCEDNGLLPDPFLTGPGDRLVLAEEAEAQYFRDEPDKTLRDWLHQGFEAIGGTQAGKSLFDRRHNPLYQIPLSHDAAKGLIGFWRRRGEQGGLVHRLPRRTVGHPVPGRPLSGPVRVRPEDVRPAADAGVRRGVHPRPDT